MKTHLLAIAAFMLLGLGFLGAWAIYRPRSAKPEPPAPAVRQKDGSLELERAPSGLSSQAPAGSSPLKPAQAIPKGAKVERIVQVTVQPTGKPFIGPLQGSADEPSAGSTSARSGAVSASACPAVTVDLSLVRMPDKSQRVLASSPDGKVVGGLDVPVQEQTFPKIQRWTVQGLAGYDSHAGRNVFGAAVSYAKGPFVVTGGAIGGTAFAGAGIHF